MLLKGGISLGVRNKGSILRIQIFFLTRLILVISWAPVIRTPCFHYRELGFDPWWGN